uniref:Uncharacterized protein n=1 Tax=Oryza sativa subsp. japonica TaxID=39947 RepID=Q5VRI4_ORYSJ|nr:hypothetical protein [Oryza sativa Japonica Group]
MPKREFRKPTICRGVLCLDDDGDEPALSCCGIGYAPSHARYVSETNSRNIFGCSKTKL